MWVGRTFVLAVSLTIGHSSRLQAQLGEPALEPGVLASQRAGSQAARPIPKPFVREPYRADAALNAVEFVGSDHGWVVGDHGLILHTSDGGQTWAEQSSGVQERLVDVCFLTNDIGWIVGHHTRPFTQTGAGFVLATQDGGRHWHRLAAKRLPRVRQIEFFSLDEGVLVGDSSFDFPTGILVTSDGGETWQPVPGEQRRGWLAADFSEPDVGAVAGQRGNLTLVGGGALLAAQFEAQDERAIRDLQIDSQFRGWLVGDGAMLLRTDSGGVSWQPPARPLPRSLQTHADFQAVEFREHKVWVAGRPGSVIWHSPDNGASWQPQYTGHPAPVNDLCFVNDSIGFAVGEWGTILRTADGGAHWSPVMNADRRAALLVIAPRADRMPLYLMSKYGADQGYRIHTLITSRSRLQDNDAEWHVEDRAQDAAVAVRTSGATVDWRYPLLVPGVEHRQDELIKHWATLHEGDVTQVILASLVAQIRQWRPSVIVIDGGFQDDAVANLLRAAVREAVKAAADDSRFTEQRLSGLDAWEVSAIYHRQAAGSQGPVTADPTEMLARVGRSGRVFAAPAFGMLQPAPQIQIESFTLLGDTQLGGHRAPPGRDLFHGLALGFDARRRQIELPDQELDRLRRLAQRQRNIEALLSRAESESMLADQVLGNLRELAAGMPPDQAALQLAELANDYERLGRWDLAEAARVELVQSYRSEPVAVAAMVWLVRLWTSPEMAWQRLRETGVERSRNQFDRSVIDQAIDVAVAQSQVSPLHRTGTVPSTQPAVGQIRQTRAIDTRGVDFTGQRSSDTQLQATRTGDRRALSYGTWLTQAVRMAELLQQRDELVFRTADLQFAMAAMYRNRGAYRESDELLGRAMLLPNKHEWKAVATSETWLNQQLGPIPDGVAACRRAVVRPHLDGLLGEECWEAVKPLRLTGATGGSMENRRDSLIYLAHDDQYLYVAGSVPRLPELPATKPTTVGRDYDADFEQHDRVIIHLDIDRDYHVGYRLAVDQRGWTQDQLWEDRSWNPRYFVAAKGESDYWSFEMAIPFAELSPQAPRDQTVWALGLSRVAPGVGYQSWHAQKTPEPKPAAFGLLQFSAR